MKMNGSSIPVVNSNRRTSSSARRRDEVDDDVMEYNDFDDGSQWSTQQPPRAKQARMINQLTASGRSRNREPIEKTWAFWLCPECNKNTEKAPGVALWKPSQSLLLREVQKAMGQYSANLRRVKQENADVLVVVNSAAAMEAGMKIRQLLEKPVTAKRTKRDQSEEKPKRVIYRVHRDYNEAQLLKELGGEGVVAVKKLGKNGGTWRLEFEAKRTPPAEIWLYEPHELKPYIPPPPRCYNCLRLFHGTSSCQGKIRCYKCSGEGHLSKDCPQVPEQPKCVDCGKDHQTGHINCAVRQQAMRVARIAHTQNTSYQVAKQQTMREDRERRAEQQRWRMTYAQATSGADPTVTTDQAPAENEIPQQSQAAGRALAARRGSMRERADSRRGEEQPSAVNLNTIMEKLDRQDMRSQELLNQNNTLMKQNEALRTQVTDLLARLDAALKANEEQKKEITKLHNLVMLQNTRRDSRSNSQSQPQPQRTSSQKRTENLGRGGDDGNTNNEEDNRQGDKGNDSKRHRTSTTGSQNSSGGSAPPHR